MGYPPLVYKNYELLFTPHLMSQLRNLRDNVAWSQLIDRLSILPETHPDVLAFAMMMVELSGCLPCQRDNYRAQRGCARCARHTIITFKEGDQQLLQRYESARRAMLEEFAETELALEQVA